ncbi:MAG: molybdenum cofactor cytidylyltransferase [Ascidiaceihabitans sp.]|jgi:molybdenum cofactor cytidylyltransferase
MKFGPVATKDAAGTVLAHSLRVTSFEQNKVYRIAKGTTLTTEHINDLIADQHSQVVVARFGADDVEENKAATRLANAIAPLAETLGLRVSAAGAGRVNLYAIQVGIVFIDEAAVMAINAIDPMITIATVPQYHRTDTDSMVATIKIISYAVSDEALLKAEVASGVAGGSAIRVLPPRYKTATLIETQVGDDVPSIKGRAAMQGRLDRLGVALMARTVVAHDETAIAHALNEASGEVVFLLTASATSDLLDVGPQALRKTGGNVTGFGMPVDPGNLLFFGDLGAKPVIGLPGCARSPALNGADWVLERLICGIKLTQADISAMGVGGLLKEIPTRPKPRASPI